MAIRYGADRAIRSRHPPDGLKKYTVPKKIIINPVPEPIAKETMEQGTHLTHLSRNVNRTKQGGNRALTVAPDKRTVPITSIFVFVDGDSGLCIAYRCVRRALIDAILQSSVDSAIQLNFKSHRYVLPRQCSPRLCHSSPIPGCYRRRRGRQQHC